MRRFSILTGALVVVLTLGVGMALAHPMDG